MAGAARASDDLLETNDLEPSMTRRSDSPFEVTVLLSDEPKFACFRCI